MTTSPSDLESAREFVRRIQAKYGKYEPELAKEVGRYAMRALDLEGRVEQAVDAVAEECPASFGPPDVARIKMALAKWADAPYGCDLRRKRPDGQTGEKPDAEDRRPPSEEELVEIARLAEEQARKGNPAGALLRRALEQTGGAR